MYDERRNFNMRAQGDEHQSGAFHSPAARRFPPEADIRAFAPPERAVARSWLQERS